MTFQPYQPYPQPVYDELDPVTTMSADCTACGDTLDLPAQRTPHSIGLAQPSSTTPASAPITVTASAMRMADSLHLHLD